MKKRILSFALAVVMVLSLMPGIAVPVLADTEITSVDLSNLPIDGVGWAGKKPSEIKAEIMSCPLPEGMEFYSITIGDGNLFTEIPDDQELSDGNTCELKYGCTVVLRQKTAICFRVFKHTPVPLRLLRTL